MCFLCVVKNFDILVSKQAYQTIYLNPSPIISMFNFWSHKITYENSEQINAVCRNLDNKCGVVGLFLDVCLKVVYPEAKYNCSA